MRRFEAKRRRLAAITLLTVATAVTTGATSQAAPPGEDGARPRISASQSKVDFGQRVLLRGAVPGVGAGPASTTAGAAGNATAGSTSGEALTARARIEFRPAGTSAWRAARNAKLDGRGHYKVRVPVRRSGTFRVLGESAQASRGKRVRVRPKVGVRLRSRNLRVGQGVLLRGSVRPGGERRSVRIRAGTQTLRTTTKRSGRFSVSWRARKAGRFPVRVAVGSNRAAAASRARARRLTVFRPAQASWYGPGLYGNRLACGGTLTPSTLGVAHRSLPCGAKLTLRLGKRSVRVRVIDRGPFIAGREFDLTSATKQRLRFGSTGTVLSSR